MKHSILVVFVALLLGTTVTLFSVGQTPTVVQPEKAPTALMAAKLSHSQKVLEGLVRKDFGAIRKGANEMKQISEAAEWPRQRDPVYEHFGREFRRQSAQLVSLADKRNHEGAMFVYLQMTTTCIQCHDYVRDSIRVAEPGARGDVQRIPAYVPQFSTE